MATEKVCLHHKFGFCKFRETWRKRHIQEQCEKVNCDIESCSQRHPKECRFYRTFGRCKFTDFCLYEHKIANNFNEDLKNELTSMKDRLTLLEDKETRFDQRITEQTETIKNLKTTLVEKSIEIKQLETKVNLLNETNFKEPTDEITNECLSGLTLASVLPSAEFSCSKCDEQFSKEIDLKKHMKTVHPVKYPCEICWQMFETERGMRNHLRKYHQLKT